MISVFFLSTISGFTIITGFFTKCLASGPLSAKFPPPGSWASEGGGKAPLEFINYQQKKVVFSMSRRKNEISPLLPPLPGKNPSDAQAQDQISCYATAPRARFWEACSVSGRWFAFACCLFCPLPDLFMTNSIRCVLTPWLRHFPQLRRKCECLLCFSVARQFFSKRARLPSPTWIRVRSVRKF